MSTNKSNSRREFFKNILGLTGFALLAPTLLSSTSKAEEQRRAAKSAAGGGAGEELVEPGKDIAGSLGYMHKSNQAGKACSGCMLYAAAGKKNGEDVGKCTVMPGKLVKAAGYCNSWAKKV